ncbi:MAG: SDR family oxidoreductase [Pigmentiphaga sp.]|nr:SDR family oxidoreductase [Pigmentiphaga sp.]
MASWDFQGATVIVTGAAGGLGATLARRFATAGAAVGLVDKQEDELERMVAALRQAGVRAAGVAIDVGDDAACARACASLEAELGPTTVLINNAGISPKHEGRAREVLDIPPEEWQRVFAVNLNGAFYMSRHLAPGMCARGHGRIVHMSSVGSLAYVGLAGAHYDASKAALNSLTRSMAAQLAPSGVTVNAIAPGRIASPMADTATGDTNRRLLDMIPAGRFGEADEVAHLALFLASRESAYITGEVYAITGGLSTRLRRE